MIILPARRHAELMPASDIFAYATAIIIADAAMMTCHYTLPPR